MTPVPGQQRRYIYNLGDETGTVNAEFEGFESILKENKMVYIRGVSA